MERRAFASHVTLYIVHNGTVDLRQDHYFA